ncbi:hypothetical protein [Vallitalea guaymasensis]|uniref:hypothetical protein n=1 Tax=Vallitalea guaymasensis TaxID=1185412 RepID=UPI000DE2D425|nr:hypothetical protein [Vallitalea guaymasensis]
MGQTKYNLNALSEKENDLIEVNKRIDYIFNRFKIIKNSVDTDIIRRDNISNQFNSLVSDFQNLVENTYNSSRIINRAITEYSDGEQQIHNLLNGLLGINNNSCGTEMNEIEHSEASISGFSILQNWFEKLYDQFISKVTHIKKFFEDNGVCVNNKDYSKTVVEDEDVLKSGVLGDLEINTYSKLESERIFRKAFEKESNYYDEDRIKKLQQYIREKGINVEVTGQLDRATFQAVNMIGIDELISNGFIQEDSYKGDGLNLFTHVYNTDPNGYCKEKTDNNFSCPYEINLITEPYFTSGNNKKLNNYTSMIDDYIKQLTQIDKSLYKGYVSGDDISSPQHDRPFQYLYDELNQLTIQRNTELTLQIVDLGITAYKSFKQAGSITGGEPISTAVGTVAIFVMNKLFGINEDPTQPSLSYTYETIKNVFNLEENKETKIQTIYAKILYIETSPAFRYLIKPDNILASTKGQGIFIKDMEQKRDILENTDLKDIKDLFPDLKNYSNITLNNIKQGALNRINDIIHINKNYNTYYNILKNDLKEIETTVKEDH